MNTQPKQHSKDNIMNYKSILIATLQRALSVKRPNESQTTAAFTQWLQDNLPEGLPSSYDAAGNLHVDARLLPDHQTLFVAHVDTVHRKEGPNKIKQTNTHWYADGAALGADDGAGVAMLMHLLHAGVDAYYVFTQGEECGGIGATWLAKHDADLLSEFDRAIAFDRRGIDSVITHQGMGRCCSDAFGEALSGALNRDDRMMYLPDDTGVYTDTAEFTDIIPECTNVSVGYYHEHGDKEYIDVIHFQALADAVLGFDWDELVTERDPTVVEYKKGWGQYDYMTDTSWPVGGHMAGTWHSSTFDEDLETEMLQDAIYDARAGQYTCLLEMIAENVYPEDPDMALKFLNRRMLTEDVLEEAMHMSRTYDAGTVLCTLFDAIHTEA
jgi:hypothetical protein